MNAQIPVSGPLSEAELDQLSDFLAGLKNPHALTLEGMDGLFSALIAGPQTVLPSEYLPEINSSAVAGTRRQRHRERSFGPLCRLVGDAINS
jgi:yecA family protein